MISNRFFKNQKTRVFLSIFKSDGFRKTNFTSKSMLYRFQKYKKKTEKKKKLV